jgi:hypothetical protein
MWRNTNSKADLYANQCLAVAADDGFSGKTNFRSGQAQQRANLFSGLMENLEQVCLTDA